MLNVKHISLLVPNIYVLYVPGVLACSKKHILILLFCLVSTITTAQNINLNQTITLPVTDSTLEYFLNIISEKADVNFSYNPSKIPVDSTISVNSKLLTLQDLFEQIFNPLQIEYIAIEQQIVLKPVKEIEKPEEEKPKEYTIKGHIKESKTSESLIGATIFVEGTTIGTISNSYGFYSLTLPEGIYNIMFSFTGLKSERQKIDLKKNITINTELFPGFSIISEIVVSAAESENIIELNQMSELNILPKTLNNINGFMGEPDLIKSFQLMPGIKLMGDGSTSFYVRGGHLDQNLILIDEAPIYNAAHLFGFFSVFVNDAIKDIKIYKGDMPASQGGRLSSLVDVKTRDGNMNKYHVCGNYGLVSGNILVEGPIKKQRSSFLVSARKSHLNWLLGENRDNLDIYFYDINVKFNQKINNNNRIFISAYFGKDYLGQINTTINSSAISWGNNAATIRWNHIFNDKLFSNFTFNASKYNYYLYLSVENDQYWNSSIANRSLKADFTYYRNPKNTYKFGSQISNHSFNPGNLHLNIEDQSGIPNVPVNQANEFVLYISNQKIISEKFSMRYGFRFTIWQNTGPTTVYLFDEDHEVSEIVNPETSEVYNTYRIPEPRLNLNYKFNKKTSLKASYVNTAQNIHMLSNSISPFTSLEVWFPSNPNIKPGRANQFALGLFRKNKEKKNEISIEGFYKKMKNQIDYKDHAKMLLNPLIEGELRFGTTRCYGIEFSYRKKTRYFDTWIAYTFSRSLRETEGINFNKEYPSTADRPHDFSLHLTYKTRGRWQFSVNWMYLSGAVFSSPTAFYYYQNYSVPVYLYKNNDRFPNYHRLDVVGILDLNKKVRRFKHHITFGLFNLYGRKNPISINFTKLVDSQGNLRIPSDHYDQPVIVPTKMAVLGFMPSITYSFKF